MIKVIMWGAGNCAETVYKSFSADTEIMAIIDSDERKQNGQWLYKLPIIAISDLDKYKYDYIVVTPMKYEEIRATINALNIPGDKVIYYWEDKSEGIFNNRLIYLFDDGRKYKQRLDSAPYEWGMKETPTIISSVDLLKKIIEDKLSMCRFGDGEFEIMRDKNRAWFQKNDKNLANRLTNIFWEDNPAIITAVAQNFVGLDRYKEEFADAIRRYMFGNTRDEIIGFFNKNKKYYDAYVSRPYLMYKDASTAEHIFPLCKRLFTKRNILIVEGSTGRTGINNGLFDGCSQIRRIVCPASNAYDKYEYILNTVISHAQTDDLIYISLGPTATVLAYDLANLGYQALDFGQLDNEYDWWKMGALRRTMIPGKFVAELTFYPEEKGLEFDRYEKEIVAVVE